jgi:hypothetical protein
MSSSTEILLYAIFMITLISAIGTLSFRIGQLKERHKNG